MLSFKQKTVTPLSELVKDSTSKFIEELIYESMKLKRKDSGIGIIIHDKHNDFLFDYHI